MLPRDLINPRRRSWVKLLGKPQVYTGGWVITALLCAFLLTSQRQEVGLPGLADAPAHTLAAPQDGRVQSLHVDLFQRVNQGDLLLSMDPSLVEAQGAIAATELARLQAELARQGALYRQQENDARTDLRRFQRDVEARELEALEVAAELEADRVELERLALALQRSEAQIKAGHLSEARWDDIRLAHQRIEVLIQRNEQRLTALQQATADARSRLESFRDELPQRVERKIWLEPFQQKVTQQQARLEALAIQRRQLDLHAPIDGLITDIDHRPGVTVTTGTPLITLKPDQATRVVGYLPESSDYRLQTGRPATLILPAKGKTPSTITAIAPGIARLDERLWTYPTVPEYGRAFSVQLSDTSLLPGQAVTIQLPP